MKMVWVVLLMGGIAWGQKPPPMTGDDCYHANDGTFHCYQGDIDTPKVQQQIPGFHVNGDPKPLKCGKYQHFVPEQSSPEWSVIVPPHCADDMHIMTEKEYQSWMYVQKTQQDVNQSLKEYILSTDVTLKEMRARLKALEKRTP